MIVHDYPVPTCGLAGEKARGGGGGSLLIHLRLQECGLFFQRLAAPA